MSAPREASEAAAPAAPHLLFAADAESACAALPPGRTLDLVYLDPPYGVGTDFVARLEKGQARGRRTERAGPTAYRDDAAIEPLVAMLVGAAAAIRERMRPGALFCLHMDHRAVHEAKVAMDGVFGRGAFVGEVVWVPGNGGRGRGFSVTHQTLLLYTDAAKHRREVLWQTDHPLLREPYAETSRKMHFTKEDADGRAFRERIINGKAYRYYADEGRRIGSVWTDIPAMSANTPLMGEGTGYPTQKPERLLERIIRAATLPGQTVADFMCGSGTTLAVAARLKRSFVGGDRSEVALALTRARLDAAGVAYRDPRAP